MIEQGLEPMSLEQFMQQAMAEGQMASNPSLEDSRNEMMENIALDEFGKPLKDLSEDEIIQIEEMMDEMGKKDRGAPSMMMAADGGRAQYGLGSLVKSVKKAVSGVVKGVKDNPLLAAAALNFAPMLAGGSPFIGFGKDKFAGSLFNLPSISSALNLKKGSDVMNTLKVGGAGAAITGLLAGMEQQEGESDTDFANRQAEVRNQLNVQFKRLYPQEGNESDEDYNIRISAMVEAADDSTIDVGNMAEGGRVNRAMGSDNKVEMAAGIEGLPINVNSKGVKEVDLRKTGGFIPPVGIKEKADDIPAMLSNNEFVFTADAVRAAGGGSVNKGAQRMYDLMKNLESKVV
jgi:hypothetical protein